MRKIAELAKKVPGARRLYRSLRGLYVSYRLRTNPTEHVFTDIFRQRLWGDGESISGPGSDTGQARAVAEALPGLFRELGVRSLLDVPCGDFHWMSRVPLDGVEYVGADIVKELVRRNRRAHPRANVSFLHLDLLRDSLPTADLILCRDCLVHLSFREVFEALRNLCEGRSRYLLTTHFPSTEENVDITTGDWRALNLEIAPFHFPTPVQVIAERCTLEGGAHDDKVMGLWRIEDLATPDARWRACAASGYSS